MSCPNRCGFPSGIAGLLALVLAAVAALSGAAQGQQAAAVRTGAIAGVISDTAGRRLERVNVLAERRGIVAVTDDSGRFHMAGLPPGEHLFTVRRIGFRLFSFEATLAPDTTIVVGIRLHPVQTLEEVEVIAAQPSRLFIATGYEARRRLGLGTFLSPDRIDSIAPYLMHLPQLFRDVRGIEVRGKNVLPRREPRCLWVFVDGAYQGMETPWAPIIYDQGYYPGYIHAIEVYERPSLVPAEFQGRLPQKGAAGLTIAAGCGAVAIWTKARR